jgi:hypothetical protein
LSARRKPAAITIRPLRQPPKLWKS